MPPPVLVTVCTMHLLGAIEGAGPYLELSIEGPDYYPWQEGLVLGNPFRRRGRDGDDPRRARWGVEIDPAWLDRAEHRASAVDP